jgi:hypothetical protein
MREMKYLDATCRDHFGVVQLLMQTLKLLMELPPDRTFHIVLTVKQAEPDYADVDGEDL